MGGGGSAPGGRSNPAHAVSSPLSGGFDVSLAHFPTRTLVAGGLVLIALVFGIVLVVGAPRPLAVGNVLLFTAEIAVRTALLSVAAVSASRLRHPLRCRTLPQGCTRTLFGQDALLVLGDAELVLDLIPERRPTDRDAD